MARIQSSKTGPDPVYEAQNLDGTNRGIVCCATLHLAAKLFGTTYYDLTKSGWRKLRGDHPYVEVARARPGVPLYLPITGTVSKWQWREMKWKRSELGDK